MLGDNKDFLEKKSRVVKISDASPEVVDQFLTFLYTGKLKDKRKKGNEDDEPVWVQMLPQIIYLGDKVSCDVSQHYSLRNQLQI